MFNRQGVGGLEVPGGRRQVLLGGALQALIEENLNQGEGSCDQVCSLLQGRVRFGQAPTEQVEPPRFV
ncbi:MAG: hypothetical protein HZY76_08145 [Anaerolineae bacterium]|nr:MAG: hypothetical protein HZY76_08145 [Anaerolineae bacterium]